MLNGQGNQQAQLEADKISAKLESVQEQLFFLQLKKRQYDYILRRSQKENIVLKKSLEEIQFSFHEANKQHETAILYELNARQACILVCLMRGTCE